jgi:hypothetical protein
MLTVCSHGKSFDDLLFEALEEPSHQAQVLTVKEWLPVIASLAQYTIASNLHTYND